MVDELDGPCLATLLRNHFTRLSVANGFRRPGATFKSSQAELEGDESLVRAPIPPFPPPLLCLA